MEWALRSAFNVERIDSSRLQHANERCADERDDEMARLGRGIGTSRTRRPDANFTFHHKQSDAPGRSACLPIGYSGRSYGGSSRLASAAISAGGGG